VVAAEVREREQLLACLGEQCRGLREAGSDLGDPPSVSGRTTIGLSMPDQMNETSRPPQQAGERRPLTVLFSDIVDSTAIAERLDPEDWTVIVNEAFERMSRAVRRYDGTVARLMGDAILAFFGAPVAHEDDPERAVRCGLDLVASIDELGERVRREHGVALRVRVGINTGPVLVGRVGSEMAHEYTAMGDAVNVAARMQSAARPGTVLVTAATHRFIAPIVDAVDAGQLELKGKTGTVRAYEIVAVRAGGTTTTRGLAGIQSPMVGREAQLAALRAAFDVVRAGQGRMACVLGEPGLGKSRLLAEFRREIERTGPPPAWIEGRCLSYGQGQPYHLVLDLVRSLLGVAAASGETEVRTALERASREALGEEWTDAYAYLGHLLSLQLEPEMATRLTTLDMEATKRYVASIHRLLRARSERAPVVLVCEDLHWADPSSVGAIAGLLPLANEMPLLCVATSRPDRASPGWRLITQAREMFGEALTELPLSPLTGEESLALIANLLEIESLPARVRDFIMEKAEGNPFFVEEVIRMLIERGAIERRGERWVAVAGAADIEIPDTLQGLLLARIDRLPDEARRVLRVASVIGRQFPLTVLERLLEPGARA